MKEISKKRIWTNHNFFSQEDRFPVILQENTGSQNIPGEYQNQTLNQW